MCGMDWSIACLGMYRTYGGRHGLAQRSGTLSDPGSRPRKIDRFANLVARLFILSSTSIVCLVERESLRFLFDTNDLPVFVNISFYFSFLPCPKYRIDFKSLGIFSKMIGSIPTRYVNSAEIAQKIGIYFAHVAS